MKRTISLSEYPGITKDRIVSLEESWAFQLRIVTEKYQQDFKNI